MQDKVEQPDPGTPDNTTIGKLLLSPTRTYAPVLKAVLENHFSDIHGLIHCSGGGQTKCMNYMPQDIRVIKDALFEPPRIFRIIQEASGADEREMFQVFNMGCRMEIYTNEVAAAGIISTASHFGLQAQVIGRVEKSTTKELLIKTGGVEIRY
jgi:phosphoribosylformylglycinamidine cyclo-ligase